jgi:predicted nucleic acid-binding protein
MTAMLLNRAMTLAETHSLRGYDAVQLAAYEVNAFCTAHGLPPLTLVSADSELNTAATGEGLPVDDPNAHP